MMVLRRKSYDELPALSVRRADLRQSLRLVTLAWVFGVLWSTCVTGSRMTNFCKMLGLSEFQFGLLASMPFLATFGQLPASILIERTGLRKYLFIYCVALSRMLWILVAAIPLVFGVISSGRPSQAAAWTMLAALWAVWFLGAIGTPAWWTWMGDLIPRRIRGRYMAARSRISKVIQVPAVIALAVWMDHATVVGADGSISMTAADQAGLLWATMGLFAVAAVLGTVDILLFRRIREIMPTMPAKPRKPALDIRVAPRKRPGAVAQADHAARYAVEAARQLLVDPLRDRVFRRYVLFGATAAAAISVAGPFFWLDMLDTLHFSQLATDALFMVMGPLVGMVAVMAWGKVMDAWGRRPVLIIGTACTVVSVTPYFFASPMTPNPPYVAEAVNWASGHLGALVGQGGWRLLSPGAPVGAWLIMSLSPLFGGIGWAGVMLGQQGIILGFADGSGRSKYVAAHAVLVSLGGVLGGLVGGAVAEGLLFLQHSPIVVGRFLWNNWHATFALSFVARVAALLLLVNMPDPGARRVREMMRAAGANVWSNAATLLFYPLRIFGWSKTNGNGNGNGDGPTGK